MINKKDIEAKVEEIKQAHYKGDAVFHWNSAGEVVKQYLMTIPLSLLESLEKDVEGMKYPKSDIDSETSKSDVYFMGRKVLLSLIKQYKEQLK